MSTNIFEKYTSRETFEKIVDYANVTEMWEHSVKTYADAVAIVDGESYTYAALDAQVSAFRTVLKDAGVAPASLIGILCPNSVGFVKAFLAAATYGAPSVLLPAHLDAMTVFGCATGFGMKAIVYDEALADKVAILKEKNPNVALIPSSATAATATKTVILTVSRFIVAYSPLPKSWAM